MPVVGFLTGLGISYAGDTLRVSLVAGVIYARACGSQRASIESFNQSAPAPLQAGYIGGKAPEEETDPRLYRPAGLGTLAKTQGYDPTRMCGSHASTPNTFSSHSTTQITTTAFKIDLIVPCIGMNRLISHSKIPTTISTITIFINGMSF
jgi:hypothetical protein